MELSDVIAKRRSIRKFRPEEISDETVQLLLNAARLAPSASNLQPWRFIVAKSPATKELLRQCTPCKFIINAAAVFVCCADLKAMTTRERRIGELMEAGVFRDIDMDLSDSLTYDSNVMDVNAVKANLLMNVAIAVEHIVLKAVDLGMGSCWIGLFDRDMVRNVLALDESIYPVVLLPVGYTNQSPNERPRLPLNQLMLKVI